MLQAVNVHAGGFELDERVFEPAGLIHADVPQVFTTAPNSMNLLGRIHHLKVGGKTANDFQCKIGIEVLDELSQFLARLFVVLTTADRAQPGVFHQLEQLFTTLLANQLADECAEHAHVIAQ